MIITDTNMAIVSSASAVPFRQFLPHERKIVPPVRRQEKFEDLVEDIEVPIAARIPGALLSSEDIGILFDAVEHTNENWEPPHEQAEELYLPFTFALAARS